MRPVFAASAATSPPKWESQLRQWQRSEKYGRNLIRLTPAKGLHACLPLSKLLLIRVGCEHGAARSSIERCEP